MVLKILSTHANIYQEGDIRDALDCRQAILDGSYAMKLLHRITKMNIWSTPNGHAFAEIIEYHHLPISLTLNTLFLAISNVLLHKLLFWHLFFLFLPVVQ